MMIREFEQFWTWSWARCFGLSPFHGLEVKNVQLVVVLLSIITTSVNTRTHLKKMCKVMSIWGTSGHLGVFYKQHLNTISSKTTSSLNNWRIKWPAQAFGAWSDPSGNPSGTPLATMTKKKHYIFPRKRHLIQLISDFYRCSRRISASFLISSHSTRHLFTPCVTTAPKT